MSTAVNNTSRGFSILYQILLTMLLISAIPLGGLFYISIYKADKEWRANIFHSLENRTETLAKRIDDWTDMNLRLLEQNTNTAAMKSMNGTVQHDVLQSITAAYPWIYLAFTISPDGNNIGRSDTKELRYYGDRDYFKQVANGEKLGQQVLMGKTSGKPAYILAKPIQSEKQVGAGVLAIAMSLEDLSATVTNTRIGNTGFAILADDNNRLIAHGKGEISTELQDMGDNPIFTHSNAITSSNFIFSDNGKKVIAYKSRTKLGWNLILQQDYDEAFRAAKNAQQQSLILLIATLVMVILVAYLLANRLSTPIRNLTSIADGISRGDLGAQISETSRGDEIGALARAIERMGVSLQMAFDRLRKKA